MIEPRYDVRAALEWARDLAYQDADSAARLSAADYKSSRVCRRLGAVDSVRFARDGAALHLEYRAALDRWCALDALVRVFDDVGGPA